MHKPSSWTAFAVLVCVLYSNDPNTRLVWISNGWNVARCGMVRFANGHLKTWLLWSGIWMMGIWKMTLCGLVFEWCPYFEWSHTWLGPFKIQINVSGWGLWMSGIRESGFWIITVFALNFFYEGLRCYYKRTPSSDLSIWLCSILKNIFFFIFFKK